VSVIQGADLSYCQWGCDYAQLRSAGVQFAWIKQVDWGPTTGFFVDQMYAKHLAGLQGEGVWTGSYCFGHVTPDPLKMADYFSAICEQDQLPPCLDMETLRDGKVPDEAGAWALAFLQRLEQNLQKTPVLYSYTSYLAAIGKQAPGLGHYPIWIAEYHTPPSADHIPKVPAPFMQEKVVAYQWTGHGRLPGCPQEIDQDVLVWQIEDLLALSQSSSTSAASA
jgi:GH25 family lysozyme M1 (1,4-beta-N-acetylmuramidase)